MKPQRKGQEIEKNLCFESLVRAQRALSSPSPTNQRLLLRVTISGDWKKNNVKFWLVAISKFRSDNLILVSFLVRKVGQDSPVEKEGFLNSADAQPVPLNPHGPDKSWIPCPTLIYRHFLRLCTQRPSCSPWAGLDLPLNFIACSSASVSLLLYCAFQEHTTSRAQEPTISRIYAATRLYENGQITHSNHELIFMVKTSSNIEVWLWVPQAAVGGLLWWLWFLSGSPGLAFLSTFTHTASDHFLAHWSKRAHSFNESSYFLPYFNPSIASIEVFSLDSDISIGKESP